MKAYDNFSLSKVVYKLSDWENELTIDFEEEQIVVLSGLNATGKTLLLSAIQKVSDVLVNHNARSILNSNEIEFKKWFVGTPIEYLHLYFRYKFVKTKIGNFDVDADEDYGYFQPEFFSERCDETIEFFDDEDGSEIVLDNYLCANQVIEFKIGRDKLGEGKIEYSTQFEILEEAFFEQTEQMYSFEMIKTISGVENLNPFTIFPFNRLPLKQQIDGFPNTDMMLTEKLLARMELEPDRTLGSFMEDDEFSKLRRSEFSKVFLESICDVPCCEIRTPYSYLLDTNREYNFQSHFGEVKFDGVEVIGIDEIIDKISGQDKIPRLWSQKGIGKSDFDQALFSIYGPIKANNINEMLVSEKIVEAFNRRYSNKSIEHIIKRSIPLSRKIYLDLLYSSSRKNMMIQSFSNVFFDDWDILSKKHYSSGQKNILVMLVQIINMIEDVDIILIDEPEISMHLGLQRNFIDNLKLFLKSLRAFTNVKFIITTHSPDIIFNNPELVLSIPPGVIP